MGLCLKFIVIRHRVLKLDPRDINRLHISNTLLYMRGMSSTGFVSARCHLSCMYSLCIHTCILAVNGTLSVSHICKLPYLYELRSKVTKATPYYIWKYRNETSNYWHDGRENPMELFAKICIWYCDMHKYLHKQFHVACTYWLMLMDPYNGGYVGGMDK